MKKLQQWLNHPVSPAGLGIFRICFGLIILWDLIRFYRIGLIDSYFGSPIVFPYDFLKLPQPDQGMMEFLLAAMTVSVLCITAGVLYRYAMLFFALAFSYMFMLDQVLYNNHLYLICLLSFMLVFIRADGALSINKKRQVATAPRWNYSILQLQLVIVYFYGGLAKLNPYWLDLHPVRELLMIKAGKTGIDFIASPALQYFIAYSGILFDLLIGFLLWIKRTRKVAIVLAILFNITNTYLFDDIYIFPFFMIAALVLFLDPDKVESFLAERGWMKQKVVKQVPVENTLKKGGLYVLGIYFLIQLALPLRHYFMPGYVDWTGEGQRFAWRMKIQHRKINEVKFAVFDLDKKIIHEVEVQEYLYPDEITHMCYSPRMIVQFAQHLEKKARLESGIRNCWVKCKVNVSFNGLPPADIFDPNQDLLEGDRRHDSFNTWINPLPAK